MSRLNNHKYSAKDIAIKVLFIMSFVGLVIGGYAISADKLSLMKKVVFTEKAKKPVIGSFRKNKVYIPSKKVLENDKRGSSVTGSRG